MGYGIKVSEIGYDVNTADDKNLSMKSGMTLLKVYDQGNISLNSAEFGNTVAHSLGYIPQYLVFVKDSGTVYLSHGYFGLLSLANAIAKINITTLYVYQTAVGAVAFYYVFYEPVDTGTAPSIDTDNNYGIKVSKDGVDVKNANILQQTFNSEKNSLKIINDGTSSITTSSGTITIPHGLAFIPGFLVFFEVDNSGYWLFEGGSEDLSGKNVYVSAECNSTNLLISINADSSAVVKVHYYILADPGESV